MPTDDAAPLAARYGRAVDTVVRQGGTPLLLPIRELAALDGDALAHLWRQATAGHRGVLVIEMAAAFGAPAPLYAAEVVTRILDIASLGGLVHASLDRGAEWARIEARDIARPDFRIYSGHERALDMVAYGSDYLLATAGCAPEAFAARDRAWRHGAPVGFELNDALQALATLLYREPIDGARHGALQWLQACGWSRRTARPCAGVALRPDTDVALYREIAHPARYPARLDRRPRPGGPRLSGHRLLIATRPHVPTGVLSTQWRALKTAPQFLARLAALGVGAALRRAASSRRRRAAGAAGRGRRAGAAATASASCRWKAGTARPTAGRPT